MTPTSDFIKLVASHVQLQESRKLLKGNCPFHPDTTNSFMVNPAKDIFKCFGCGIEGGAAEFTRAISQHNT